MVQRILIIIIVPVLFLFASGQPDKVTLKDGETITAEINKVYTWGIGFSDNRTCMYKVIAKIITEDSILVSRIVDIAQDIQISRDIDSNYILDLRSVKYEIRKVEYYSYFNKRSIQTLFGFNSTPNIDVRFSAKPTHISFILCEVSFSLNWKNDSENNKMLKPGFGIGAGLYKDFDFFEISLLAKYISQTGIANKNESFYLSSNLRSGNIYGNLFLILSWNYYFNKYKIQRSQFNNVFYFGLGFNI